MRKMKQNFEDERKLKRISELKKKAGIGEKIKVRDDPSSIALDGEGR